MKLRYSPNFYFFILLLFSLIFSSCKKDFSGTQDIEQTKQQASILTEIAFPKIKGQILESSWNNLKIKVEKKGNLFVWLGDIAFDQKTYDSLNKISKESVRTFNSDCSHQWTHGQVYYLIDNNFSTQERNNINAAINHWTNNSSLHFISRTTQTDYIFISKGIYGSGLYSDYIGKKGGQQIINLEGNSGFSTGNVIHEIGHAIGFYHEQSRTDRDNSIQILWQNIISGASNNFETYSQSNLPGSQIGAFDFNSIMLYSSFAFSSNGFPTITRLDGSTFSAQRLALSAGDIETSNFLYGPPFAKIIYQQTSLIDESSDVNEWHREEGTFYISFYSDPACTTPFTLNTTKEVDYLTSSDGNQPYLVNLTLNPGQQSYPVSDYLYEYRSEYGNVTSYTKYGAVTEGNCGFYR